MTDPERTDDRREESGARARALLLGLPLVVLVALVALFFLGGEQRPEERDARNAPESRSSGGVEQSGGRQATAGAEEAGLPHPSLGSEDAPVVMVEYADYQCPYCGRFAREVEPELVERYVEDGTLRIEWRDFPYLGQESVNAALAARAAQAQGKFWEYHRLLFENQGGQNSGGFSDERLIELAGEADLDVERFREDLQSGRYEEVVARDFAEGQARGVSGTPAFIVNDRVIIGLQPLEVFERAIEEERKEAAEDG
ncbi:MAG: thioredoxin domain-containing protein [Actinomycetota bacterium]